MTRDMKTKELQTGAASHPDPGVNLHVWYSAAMKPVLVVKSMVSPPILMSSPMQRLPSSRLATFPRQFVAIEQH